MKSRAKIGGGLIAYIQDLGFLPRKDMIRCFKVILVMITSPVFLFSSGMFISSSEDKTGILDLIEKKLAKDTMIPRSHGESFNVLRYEIGQRYNSHYDAFNLTEYGPQKSQRIASFLLYLSDVEKGGETMFPLRLRRCGDSVGLVDVSLELPRLVCRPGLKSWKICELYCSSGD